jgi:hypothetical protein
MALLRAPLRPAYGCQPADGHPRRYHAPTAVRTVGRYDAPSSRTARVDVPSARVTGYRAPSPRTGTTYSAPAPRRRREIGA